MDYSVYKHTFPNGKVYMGMTKGDVEKRWQHGHGYKAQKLIFNAIVQYGWENVKHEVLHCNLSKEEAEKIEIDLITEFQSYKCNFGYNVLIGKSIHNLRKEDMIDSNTYDYLMNVIQMSKTRKPVMCIETGEIYLSLSQASNETKLTNKAIAIACNVGGKAGDYHWKYIENEYN